MNYSKIRCREWEAIGVTEDDEQQKMTASVAVKMTIDVLKKVIRYYRIMSGNQVTNANHNMRQTLPCENFKSLPHDLWY